MPRDTQFSKFADGVVQEIVSVHDGAFQASDWWQEQVSKIIARRAYDFARYVSRCNGGLADIPDVTKLPEVSE